MGVLQAMGCNFPISHAIDNLPVIMDERQKYSTALRDFRSMHSIALKALINTYNIMLSTVNQVGEFVTGEIRKDGNGFIVDKAIDGMVRISYPADSYGRAKMLLNRIVKQ